MRAAVGRSGARVLCFSPEYDVPAPAPPLSARFEDDLGAFARWIGGQVTVVGDIRCVAPAYRRDADPDSLNKWTAQYDDLCLIEFLRKLPADVWQQCYPEGWALWRAVPVEVLRPLDERCPSLLSANLKGLSAEDRSHVEFRVSPVLRAWIRYRGVGVAGCCLWKRHARALHGKSRVATNPRNAPEVRSLAKIPVQDQANSPTVSPWKPYAGQSLNLTESYLSVSAVCKLLQEATQLHVVPARSITDLKVLLTPGTYSVAELGEALPQTLQLRWRWFEDQDVVFLADDLYASGRRHLYRFHDHVAMAGWRTLRARLTEPPAVREAVAPFAAADFFQFRSVPYSSLPPAQQQLVVALLREAGLKASEADPAQLSVTLIPGAELYFRAPSGWWTGGGPESLFYQLTPSLAR